ANRTQDPRSPGRNPFLHHPTQRCSSSGITPRFRGLPPGKRQIPHVFLTRPPREPPEGDPVRLACIRHAASVDPEPGSNSPPSCVLTVPPVPPVATGSSTRALFLTLVWLGPPSPQPPVQPHHRRPPKSAPDPGPPPAADRNGGLLRLPHTTSPV